jgi:small GTP-binding protein
MGDAEKIKEIEEFLSKAKYNKSTEHAFGVMKAQIARLREKQEKRMAAKGGGKGFFVKKSGDATVVLLGFPSVGKSSLLNVITKAKSAVAAYAFTTLTAIPGTLEHRQAKIQIIDVPGIVEGAASGRGRGKEVLAMVRNADLILMLLDALHPEHYPVLQREIYETGVRINERSPDVRIVKRSRGGIDIHNTVPLKVDRDTLLAVLKEFRIGNADVVIRSPINIDQFIDAIEANKSYIPAITVINKIDVVDDVTRRQLISAIKPTVCISATTGENIIAVKDAIFDGLGFVRVYLKEINKKPDMEVPLVLKSGATLRSVCEHIHRDFVKKFKFARVWGKNAKFPGQQIRDLKRKIDDADIVEIHTT